MALAAADAVDRQVVRAVEAVDRRPVLALRDDGLLIFQRAPPRRLQELAGYYAEPRRPQRHLLFFVHQSKQFLLRDPSRGSHFLRMRFHG